MFVRDCKKLNKLRMETSAVILFFFYKILSLKNKFQMNIKYRWIFIVLFTVSTICMGNAKTWLSQCMP